MKSQPHERQLALLRRIADGSEPMLPSEHHLAVSIYALRSRRLVTTTGLRRFWTAEVTELGRSVLEPGAPSDSGRASSPARVAKESAAGSASIQQLVETRVAEAARPVQPPPVLPVAPPAVPILERLVRPHPLIAATRDGARRASDGWVDTMRVPGLLHMRVAPASLRRVLLIAQSIILEALRRGHGVEPGAQDRRCAGGLCIVGGGYPFEFTFVEETDREAHVATRAELDRAARRSWERIPDWDRFPSGRLQLRCGHESDRPLATDRVRWRLEDRLDRALAEIERRAEVLEQCAIERQRQLEQQRLEWEAAVRVARAQLIESQRSDLLRKQTEAWRHASEIRCFIQAVRDRGAAGWATDPSTEEWLTWAAEHADAIDPLLGRLLAPDAPEPTPAALEPFLKGWSPYGPDRLRSAYRGH